MESNPTCINALNNCSLYPGIGPVIEGATKATIVLPFSMLVILLSFANVPLRHRTGSFQTFSAKGLHFSSSIISFPDSSFKNSSGRTRILRRVFGTQTIDDTDTQSYIFRSQHIIRNLIFAISTYNSYSTFSTRGCTSRATHPLQTSVT
jgi:hypothetical protein